MNTSDQSYSTGNAHSAQSVEVQPALKEQSIHLTLEVGKTTAVEYALFSQANFLVEQLSREDILPIDRRGFAKDYGVISDLLEVIAAQKNRLLGAE